MDVRAKIQDDEREGGGGERGENEREEHVSTCAYVCEKRKGAMDNFKATERIRSVVDRVFRVRGAVGAQKKLCRRAQPLYFRLI